jgi:hypothetical protein
MNFQYKLSQKILLLVILPNRFSPVPERNSQSLQNKKFYPLPANPTRIFWKSGIKLKKIAEQVDGAEMRQ